MLEKIGNWIFPLKSCFSIGCDIRLKVSANLGFSIGIGPKPKQWVRSYTSLFNTSLFRWLHMGHFTHFLFQVKHQPNKVESLPLCQITTTTSHKRCCLSSLFPKNPQKSSKNTTELLLFTTTTLDIIQLSSTYYKVGYDYWVVTVKMVEILYLKANPITLTWIFPHC